MKRPLMYVGLALACLLTAAGCAKPGTEPGAGPDQPLTSAPIDAALVTPQFGWVLTADQMLLSGDGGKTFHSADLALPTGTARAAYFRDAQQGWVAATDGSTVAVARTSDGGDTWKVSTIRATEPIDTLSVGFGDAARGVVLAKVQTSAAFSKAELFATADGGASWSTTTAPVAGRIAVEPGGRVWVAGGVLDNDLYASSDQGRSWSHPQLQLARSAPVSAIAPPQGGILPVTVTDAGRSRVALLRSDDAGSSWHETGSVPLKDGADGAAPTAVAGSAVVVVDPAGNGLHRAMAGGAGNQLTVSKTRADGLPAGVSRVTFASRAGWALASAGACTNGKQHCSITYTLVLTGDGGDTWRQVLRWEAKIS